MTKIFSLTNRLVIWFSLAFAVSSTVLFGTFYYLTVQTLLDQTDREILDHARALAYSENTLRASFESIPGMIIAITDASGQIRVSSSLSTEDLKDRLEIKESGDEIEELSHSFNHLLSRLEESFDRERQFIADIAHELKTPLTIIRSSMEVVLGKNRSNNDYRKTMEETVKVVDRLSGVVNDVLELARSKTEQDSNLFKTADLTSVVRDISELTEKLAVSKRISVSQKITSGVTIPGERQKLFRALFNLADNAVKYTPASGKIGIRLEKEKDHALFEISNTGKGIQPAELPNIFNRFYQGTGDRDTQGSGLGLAICKSIIEAHKGKISVFSQPGKTTVFKIHLPLTK